MSGWLVVNADDLGMSRSATVGIIAAHREGVVTSASLAVTTSCYQHAVDACVRTCPELGIGLHFSLTSGAPVGPRNAVSRLVGSDGFFRWRFTSLLRAVAGTGSSDLLDQVEMELDAQLDRLAADDIRPDHIDGERHVHLIPGILERVVAVARRRDIPFVRLGSDAGLAFMRGADLPAILAGGGLAKSWLLSKLTRQGRAYLGDSVHSVDRVASYVYTGRTDLMMRRLLEGQPLPGITELMVHPGVQAESEALDVGNHETERYLRSTDRQKELAACVAAKGWETEWRLTTFRQLAQKQVKPAR